MVRCRRDQKSQSGGIQSPRHFPLIKGHLAVQPLHQATILKVMKTALAHIYIPVFYNLPGRVPNMIELESNCVVPSRRTAFPADLSNFRTFPIVLSMLTVA